MKNERKLRVAMLTSVLIIGSACSNVRTDCASFEPGCGAGALLSYFLVFSPANITSLRMWFRGSDLSGADGSPVSTWSDASGNGNDATQGTGSMQPLLRVNGLGNNPALEFDGVDDFLNGVPLQFTPGDAPFTIIAVVRRIGSVASFPNIISIGANINNRAYSLFLDTSGAYATSAKAGTGAVSADTNTLNRSLIVSGTYTGGAGEYQVYTNGVRTGAIFESAPTPSWNPTAFRIGDDVGAAQNFAGLIAEIIVFDAALSDGDRAGVECGLSRRYGLFPIPPCLAL